MAGRKTCYHPSMYVVKMKYYDERFNHYIHFLSVTSTTSFVSICDRSKCGWKTFTYFTAELRKQIGKHVKMRLKEILLIPPLVLPSRTTIRRYHLTHRTSSCQRTVLLGEMTLSLVPVRFISMKNPWYQ